MDEQVHGIRNKSAMLDDFSSIFAGVKCHNPLFGVRVAKVTLTKSAACEQKRAATFQRRMLQRSSPETRQDPYSESTVWVTTKLRLRLSSKEDEK